MLITLLFPGTLEKNTLLFPKLIKQKYHILTILKDPSNLRRIFIIFEEDENHTLTRVRIEET